METIPSATRIQEVAARIELEHDRRIYLANLQAQYDARLITEDEFEEKAEQWADPVN